MKKILILIFTHAVIIGYGQINRNHKIAVSVGNEWNTLLRPSTLEEDGEISSMQELWDNGTFQSISLKNTLQKKGEKYRLKFKVNGSVGIYQTEENSNRYTYRIGASYRVNYADKKYFEVAPEVFRKQRAGVNVDNAVLTTPFSYTLVTVPIGLDFYLGEKTWLKTTIGYLYKSYDQPGDEELFYKAPFVEALISKKLASTNHKSKFSLKSTTQRRQYEVLSLIQQEDEDQEPDFREGSRDWTYQFTNLIWNISRNDDKRKASVGLYHTSRIDANRNSTFHEIGPGIDYQISSNKVVFKSSLKYTFRNYQRLSPGQGNDTPLRYRYLRGSLGLDYSLTKKTQLFGRANVVNRTSNNPNLNSFRFREYFNAYLELGVKVDW